MDAVILCGGQGTRIRHLLPEGVPKIMMDINGTPFVDLLCRHLYKSGVIEHLLFLAGYGSDKLIQHLQCRIMRTPYRISFFGGLQLSTPWSMCVDESLLGTAGSIYKHSRSIRGEPFLILNGDTYCDVDYKAMLAYHKVTNSTITVAHDDQFRHVGTFIASTRFANLIPKTDGRVDMSEVFALLGQKHEPVGWFYTDAPFYDIGNPSGLQLFKTYWNELQTKKTIPT